MLLTGSNGLIGGELVSFFAERGWEVFGIDNNMRADFFGPSGDTQWNQERLRRKYSGYHHNDIDLRSREMILHFVKEVKPDAVIHAAAQPSHDLASKRPFDDFDINAVGTLNLLEACRQTNRDVPFVFMSTNKVYGDAPNSLELVERETRWEYADRLYYSGIREDFGIDQSKHSLFGASKLAADILVQEYGKYFGMPTVCLRCGCLTGPGQSGVEAHGFLSYLIKCHVYDIEYTIFGYKGKQVRDNLHSLDVAFFIHEFLQKPKVAEVYNLGGGRTNSISILEAFRMIESISDKRMIYGYSRESRPGDHICYISDLSKIQRDYPNWSIRKDLRTIFEEIYAAWYKRKESGKK